MNINISLENHFQFEDKDNQLSYIIGVMNGQEIVRMYEAYGEELFAENVRTYLGNKTSVNKSIQQTIKENPNHFFPFNNGATICAQRVDYMENKLALDDASIINGAQSLNSVYDFYVKNKNLPYIQMTLKRIRILIKIVIIASHDRKFYAQLNKNVNTQNTVKASDYFSNEDIHEKIKAYLKKYKIFYEIKRGETTLLTKEEKVQWLMTINKEVLFRSYIAVFHTYGSSDTGSNKIFKYDSDDEEQITQKILKKLSIDFENTMKLILFAVLLLDMVSKELKNFNEFYDGFAHLLSKESPTEEEKTKVQFLLNQLHNRELKKIFSQNQISSNVLKSYKFYLGGKGKYFYAFFLRNHYEQSNQLEDLMKMVVNEENFHFTNEKILHDLYRFNQIITPILAESELSENKITMSTKKKLLDDCLNAVKGQ